MSRFLFAAALALAATGSASAATYKIDPRHTQVFFTYAHNEYSNLSGRLNEVDGTLEFDPAKPAASSISIELPISSLSTGVPGLDTHMQSADFFDMEKFPTASFKSTKVSVKDATHFDLSGDLTIKGVTNSVTVPFDFEGAATDPFGNLRVGFEGSVVINRKDYGITWNAALETGGVLVSEKVKLEFDVSAIRNA